MGREVSFASDVAAGEGVPTGPQPVSPAAEGASASPYPSSPTSPAAYRLPASFHLALPAATLRLTAFTHTALLHSRFRSTPADGVPPAHPGQWIAVHSSIRLRMRGNS